MIHSLRAMLANVELFEVLRDDFRAELSRRGTTLGHRPGRVIVRQGSPEAGPQLVVEGSAEVSVDGVAGTTMAPGAYFGEISLLDHQPPSATVTAGPDGLTTFALPALEFGSILDERPEIARTLLVALRVCIRRMEAAQRPVDG